MNRKRYWIRGCWGEIYYTELVQHEEANQKYYEVHEIKRERELREGDLDPQHWCQEYVDRIIRGDCDDLWDMNEDVRITEEEALWELIK